MLAPILRLVLTYLVLIAAVVAVFNRDKIAGLFSSDERPAAVTAAPVPTPAAPTPSAAPVQPAPTAAAPAPTTQPVYGSDLQTPVATGEPAVSAIPGTAPNGPAPTASVETAVANAVNAARAAFWAGDVEGAKAQMLALSRAHPGDADVLGELGNLHFALRDYPAAADAWYRAGILLIQTGEGPQRRGFMQALAMIDPEKAADLAAKAQGR